MTILLTGIIIFVSRALEAITGFGGTVLALPFIVMLLGVQEGVMMLTIITWLFSLYVVGTKFRDIDLKQYLIIASLLLLGLPIGMYLFRLGNVDILKKILAVIITFSAGWQLLQIFNRKNKECTEDKKINKWYYGLLFVGGIVHGMFSCGGTLAVYYTSKAIPDKGKFRATLCLLWTTLNSVLIVGYFFDETLRGRLPTVGIQTLWSLPFLVVGIICGELIHKRINAKVFSIIVFAMLLIIGIFMLVF